MRLLSWLLCAAVVIVPAITLEERRISRPKRDSSEKKIVCYYTNWSVYRPGTAKFTPQNINPYLCTHLIYAFGGLSKDNALKPFDKYQDIEQGGYAKFNGLKTYNKNLKTMLAIGGWNEGSARFSPLVADAERRKELVKNTVKFLRQNHFDGLDLDWEYPSFRDGGKPRDRDNYATLVQEFREEFERESEKTGRPRLLLTMAVPAGIEYIDKGYDVPKLNKYLDWMNILSYDYHSAFEPAVNHHSPLFSLEEDDEYNFDAALNIDHTVQHYIKLGADKSKLVLGIPTYGRSYTLFNPDATDIGAPADGPGEQGEATREKGYLAYYEICERVSSGGWTLENANPEAMGPYAYKGNQWVGFDDEDIVKIKAKYVNDNDLGGIMFWSIDNDDFRGKCHGKPYPLIEAAKEALLANANELVPSTRSGTSRSNSKKQDQETSSKSKTRKTRLRTKSSTTTESSQTKSSGRTSTTPQPPTTPDPGSDFVCKDEGFFPHPRDCKKYFWCLDSGPSSLGIVAHQFTCPSGLVFNKISDSCDYARNVICKTKSELTSTTTSTTSTTTTTTTTTARTTTARSRLVITASPPKITSTTITEAPDKVEEPEEDEEDPGTIKELINLIKKLGGVEQLEKQLNLQNSDGKEKIKPSLYTRVLQGRTANRYRGVNGETSTSKYVSAFRNRPAGFQNPNTEETTAASRGSDKPRYVTIQRNRPTKKPTKVEEESEEEEEEEEEEQSKQLIQETPRSFRRRPDTDTTTEKEYVVLRRSRPPKEEDISTPKYKNIVRIRATTEAAVEKEENVPEEKEEEVVEEEEEEEEEEEAVEEIEPIQKVKKYSSIIRDNKKVIAEEAEPKVSGPQGSQHESGDSSATTVSVLNEKENVNNVNTVTSPRYVEIRRTQTTSTETTDSNVHNVNNLHHNNQENIDETNELYGTQPEDTENNVKGFQRRITTEIDKRVTRPSFRIFPLVSTTPITFETNNDIKTFRYRERQSTTTEAIPTFSTRPHSQYKTLSRNTPIFLKTTNHISETQNENRFLKQEERFKSSSLTSETPTTEPPRRFKFAPRTKPSILSPNLPESTTEVFKITVPNILSPTFTEESLHETSFPSVTLEPTTLPNTDITVLNVPENNVLATFEESNLSSTNQFIPTTSTQTSVVTSITESSFTERKRIFVPKKDRSKSEVEFKLNTNSFITEGPLETTKPFYRASLNKITARITTTKGETATDARKSRFKIKTTSTTTTEEPTPAKKYVAKKIRTFKRLTSTEAPEVTSNTTEKTKFQPRNKIRRTENGQQELSNSLQSRFGTARRKIIFSKKEEDDLEVQQTATFFGDDLESHDRYILGGALKQTSEKDYLNADVLFRTVPTVEEEKLVKKTDEELKNSLNKIADIPFNKNDKTEIKERKENIRNKLVTNNPALRNLRTRTRQVVENVPVTEIIDSNTSLQPLRSRGNTRSNILASNLNFRTLMGRTQPNNNESIDTHDKDSDALVAKLGGTESVQSLRARRVRPNNRIKLENNESVITAKQESGDPEAGFSSRIPGIPVTSTRNSNFRHFRNRTRQNQLTNEKLPSNTDFNGVHEANADEVLKNDVFSRFKAARKPTKSSNDFITEGDAQHFLSNKTRNQTSIENFSETKTEATLTDLPTKSTKAPSIYSTIYSSQRTTKENVTGRKSAAQSTKEQIPNNFIVSTSATLPVLEVQNKNVIKEEDSVLSTTISSTFGTKIRSSVGSTSAITASTKSPAIQTVGTIRGTYITVAPKVLSSKTEETVKADLRLFESSNQTQFRANAQENGVNDAVDFDLPHFRSFRTRTRQNTTSSVPENSKKPLEKIKSNSNPKRVTRIRGKVKALDSIFQATKIELVNETETENRTGRIGSYKSGRRVLVRRPVQSTPEIKVEENELEPPEEQLQAISKATSDKRVTPEYQSFRSRGRSTTQPPETSDRPERKRTQLDRRRFRGEIKSTTLRPEVQTETSSNSPRANIFLRRKSRPTTSTTTTTTTTEEPYIEQQGDSRLEESKSLDENPGIQDLADPAVVAIHNLATVSPGPLASAVTSLSSYSQTPATYTVHVTPSDIASFSTPANIVSVTPGSVSSRPASILTLKPYTVPLITRQYVTKQTPSPFRSTSLLRETEIPVVTKEPYNPRSEILIQSRKQETNQRAKPITVINSTPQKEAAPKPRRLKPFSKVPKQEVSQSASSSEPPVDYEYYDDDEDPLANIPASALKVKVHSDGYIECLDRGNFPHPFSCKKFISCAKMENNELLGWEYTCPKHLSFDPVGGICNWSAGLGCQH